MAAQTSVTTIEEALARIELLEDALLQERERARALEAERDRIRLAYQEALIALELLRRRIEAAKAERVDTTQLEIEFEARCKALDELAGKLAEQANEPPPPPPPKSATRRKPKGRRNLSQEATLPVERIEVPDPEMERLVAEGKAERFGFDEESSKVRHRRASKVLLKIARVKYRIGKLEGVPSEMLSADSAEQPGVSEPPPAAPSATDAREHDAQNAAQPLSAASAERGDTAPSQATSATDVPEQNAGQPSVEHVSTAQSEADVKAANNATTPAVPRSASIDRRNGTTLVTATMPPSIVRRSIGAPSLFASIIALKLNRGMPLYRQEDQLALDGFPLGRGTMSRWMFELGTKVGETVLAAMWAEAKAHAFCMSTDATGVLVQPEPRADKKRQACKRGHYFCVIADRDHVFFEYTPREDSKAVMRIFRGYSGYVQADAKSVYDILFRAPDPKPPDDPDLAPDGATRHEVGCMTHCRRKFFECAVATQSVAAREALLRIHRLYEYEEQWRAGSPAQRKQMRQRLAKPELEAFFAWVESLYEQMRHQRGLLTSALGYSVRHKQALMRYLDDGRISIDNTHTERQIKLFVLGRKAWLFIGDDDHGQPTGHLMALVASCKLHGLDPEAYLRDLFCVLPQWPSDRYLELAPKYWRRTRARLVEAELEREIAWFTIPPPLGVDALRKRPTA
ncbi:MAG: IS66 family transposase [Deltaproteobacteria bacterium]|nr:IS66 family transposase [Deltaproteobacteria bacterium]